MANTTSVPPIQFTPTGLVVPAESAVLAGVTADWNGALGGNMNPVLTTPQGQVITSTTAIIAQNNGSWAELVDQIDPDNATGFMQDAIGRIYFLNRKPGTPTAVQLLCIGAFNTPIPVGAQAEDTSGNIYVCTQAGVIPIGGQITLSFANIVNGPVACPANTVTKIYQAIPGWDTVNNPTQGVPGTNVETAAEFEFRRQNSVALNAHGSLPSIYAEVFDVANVTDVYATENVTDNSIQVGSTGYTLLPHSVYVGVIGGAAADIANAIWIKKDLGCNMNGNTSVVVTDTSGYSFPFPTYTIKYNIPTATPINFIVNVVNSSALPGTIQADISNAITAQFNGVVGVPQANGIIPATSGQRARIGALLLAASYYGPVASCEGPSVPVQVLSIFIGTPFVGTGTITDGSDVLTVASVTSGTVSVGNVVTMTGIPTGTTIVQQLTGSPGVAGTYLLSAEATAGETGVALTMAGGTAAQIGIDQAPTLATVTVNLIS
jgi:uncharacterized phage protein gp47/JayE